MRVRPILCDLTRRVFLATTIPTSLLVGGQGKKQAGRGKNQSTNTGDGKALVTACRITFFTQDDDKDDDSVLDIRVDMSGSGASGTIANPDAWLYGIRGHFPDDSKNGPFTLNVRQGLRIGFNDGVSVGLGLTPNGNDTWKYEFEFRVDFEDGRWWQRACGAQLNAHRGETHRWHALDSDGLCRIEGGSIWRR